MTEVLDRLYGAIEDLDAELALIKDELLQQPEIMRNFEVNFDLERDEAIQNAKTYHKALLDYTSALVITGDRTNCLKAVELLRGEDSEQAYFFRSLALTQLGQYRDARLGCEHVLMRKCPTNTIAVESLARALLTRIRNEVSLNGWSGIGVIFLVAALASGVGSLWKRES